MDVLASLAVLLLLSMPVMVIVTLVKVCRMKRLVDDFHALLTTVAAAGSASRRDSGGLALKPGGVAPAPAPASGPVPTPGPVPARKPQPVPEPLPAPVQKPRSAPGVMPEPVVAPAVPSESKPTAVEVLFARIGDWLAVRGEFAPEGMTREFAFVTRWLIRIGAALLLGCAVYFMKLSIDRGWVGPAARTVSIIVWGAVFAVGGAWMVRKSRYAPIGHAFAGLGFVCMYLGFGLGHRFYNPPVIESATFAFTAMTVVTVLAGVYAVKLPSASVAVLGLVGGYLVPVIAGKDSGNPVGLYCYLLMLNVAAAFIAHYRRWSALNFFAAGLAFAMCAFWHDSHRHCANWIYYTSFVFLSVVHAVYLAATVAGARRRDSAGNAIAWAGLGLNAAGYLAWLLLVLRPIAKDGVTGLILLALVAVYAVLANLAIRRGWADKVTVQMMLIFAFAYLGFAPLMVVARLYWVTAWCIIAIATNEAARRSQQAILGYLSLILLVFVSALSLTIWTADAYSVANLVSGEYLPGLVSRIIRFTCVPVALGVFAWRSWSARSSRELRVALWVCAAFTAFIYLTCEAQLFGAAFVPGLKGGMVTLTWGVAAIGALLAGILGRIKSVRVVSLVLLAVSVSKLLFSDTAHLATPYRVLTFGVTGAVLIVGAIVYIKFKERFENHE